MGEIFIGMEQSAGVAEAKSVLPPHLALGGLATAASEPTESWGDRALCAQTDPEVFFPEQGGSTREAKRVCLGCDVRDDCLEYALVNNERFGIWGGLSEQERRKLKTKKV